MNRFTLLRTLLILGSLSWMATLGMPQAVPTNTADLIRGSKFIFQGRVEKLHASNLRVLPSTNNTTVVRVEEVLYAPKTLNDFTGQNITVQLVNPASLKVGEEAIFFTNGWLYGESIAVTEVGHTSARVSRDEMLKQIADIHGRVEDEKLQSRIALASLVIVGKVTATHPLKEEKRGQFTTEHDPLWWQAQIEVRSVEKGQPRGREVTILFPSSDDEMWIQSPKFKPGDEGIWILQEDQRERGFPSFRAPGLTALDRLDFQPVSELDRIRRLKK